VWAAEVAADDVRLALAAVEEPAGLGGELPATSRRWQRSALWTWASPNTTPQLCWRTGRRAFDMPLANNEPRLRELFARLQRKGRVLVVVDQPAFIGALPVAVARANGCGGV
jgi:hypothetical protein